ncbi:MAG: hypothetical protein OJF59_001243 [Cytophagales bacterium]|jgi:outer membrane lipoprotein-sorting protein|nr:outer membrane lipoprotein-sorting protein [Bacteroidota bacterium]MBS1981867.1 outer membrane lipoprotein-sorting protein [Bacteroidota bacterium]WHZ07490.1 MAG: hypothetical protein OJF59_001243 [Cytophagales bacterium]
MKYKFVLALLTIASFTVAKAQTVDEIIAKYFENTGGMEKWKALQGIKMSAKANQGGIEIPIVITQLKDGRQATSINFQGKDIKQGVYDGTTLWSTNFVNMKAEKSDAETTENFKKDIGEFPDPFLTYKERGLKAELLGKETIDGAQTFKIKLTKKPIMVDGKEAENIVYYYFDSENFVPLVIEQEIKTGQMKGAIQQNKMSDYQDVDGLMFPFSLAQGIKDKGSQTLTISKIELNPKVDPSIFVMPKEN